MKVRFSSIKSVICIRIILETEQNVMKLNKFQSVVMASFLSRFLCSRTGSASLLVTANLGRSRIRVAWLALLTANCMQEFTVPGLPPVSVAFQPRLRFPGCSST